MLCHCVAKYLIYPWREIAKLTGAYYEIQELKKTLYGYLDWVSYYKLYLLYYYFVLCNYILQHGLENCYVEYKIILTKHTEVK